MTIYEVLMVSIFLLYFIMTYIQGNKIMKKFDRLLKEIKVEYELDAEPLEMEQKK